MPSLTLFARRLFAPASGVLTICAALPSKAAPAPLFSDEDLLAVEDAQRNGLLRPEQARTRIAELEAESLSEKAVAQLSLQTGVSWVDRALPPFLLRGRLAHPSGWSGGLLSTLARHRFQRFRYEPTTQALWAAPPQPSVHLPKFHLGWESPGWKVLLGHFRLGFAERLVLDITQKARPHGFVADLQAQGPSALEPDCDFTVRSTCVAGRFRPADFQWTEGFRGLVWSAMPERRAWTFTGFLSHQQRALRSSELRDLSRCADDCASLPLRFLGQDQRLQAQPLAQVLSELAAGGHVEVGGEGVAALGLTSWSALPRWQLAGMKAADFRAAARYPSGGAFGAGGLNGRARWRELAFFMELARSWDHERGGGWGAVQRTQWERQAQRLTVSWRVLAPAFANPYARPESAPDEWEGLRAQDEWGVRLRHEQGGASDWRTEAEVDISSPLSQRKPAMRGELSVRSPWSRGVRWRGLFMHRRAPTCEDCAGNATQLLGAMEWRAGEHLQAQLLVRSRVQPVQWGGRVQLTWEATPRWGWQGALGRAATGGVQGQMELRGQPVKGWVLKGRYDGEARRAQLPSRHLLRLTVEASW